MGRFINADVIVPDVGETAQGYNVFAYANSNPVNNRDDKGTFCVPAAIVGGVLSAGLSIASSVMAAAVSGQKLDVGKMLLWAAADGAVGAITTLSGEKMYSVALSIAKGAMSFGKTLSNGGSISEAFINAGATLVTELVSIHVGVVTMPGSTTDDLVGNAVLSSVISGETQGLQQTATVVYNAAKTQQSAQTTKRPTQSTSVTKRSSRTATRRPTVSKTTTPAREQYHIHAFGAW